MKLKAAEASTVPSYKQILKVTIIFSINGKHADHCVILESFKNEN